MVHYHIPSTDSLKVAGSGDTQVFFVAWKPGQSEVLACATSRGGKIINVEDREVVLLGTDTDRTDMTWVAWSPSGNLLVTLGEQNIIWNSDGGRVVTLLGQPRGSRPKLSPSGRLVAIIRGSTPTFYSPCDVYDTITGELLQSVNSYTWHDSQQNTIVWKDEISFFCSGDPDTINLWRVGQDQDEPVDVIRATHRNGVMAYNPDKDMLAFIGIQGAIWLYSVQFRRDYGRFYGHPHGDQVVQLVWKPDFLGILASRSVAGRVRIWDAIAKTSLYMYDQEMSVTPLSPEKFFYGLSPISFSPEWNFFAIAGLDRKVKIVKVDSGETVAEFEEKGVAVDWGTNGDKLAVRHDQGLNSMKNVSVYSLEKITTAWKTLKVLSTMRVASLLEKKFKRDEAKEFLQNKEGFLLALVPDVCAYLPQN